MDIFDLKRALRPLSGFYGYNSDGGGGEGTSNGPPGPSGGSIGGSMGAGGNPAGGLSIGSSGLGLGAGYSYSGPGTTSFGSGLTNAAGNPVGSGPGLTAGGSGGGIGDGIGSGLSGVSGMGLGLSPSQNAQFSSAIATKSAAEQASIVSAVNFFATLALPATALANLVLKATTGETIGSILSGAVRSGDISQSTADSATAKAATYSGFTNAAKGGGSSDSSTGATNATAGTTGNSSTAPANPDPATLANNIANQTWSDWNGTEKKALQATVDANAQRGNALYDSSLANSQSQLALSKQMQGDYNTIYRPAGQQYANHVNQLGTQAYQDQQRGISMGDVQQQIDSQQGQMQRTLQRQGVNPSSGRMMAMNNQNSIMGAAAKAQAAGMSDRNVKADWSKGLTTMASMGNDNLRASQGLDSSAQGWATNGLNAGNTAYTQGMGMSQMGLAQASGASTAAGRAGDIINGVSASNRADAAANPWTTAGGAALGYLGSDLAKNGKTSAVGSAFDWLTSSSTT